MNSIATINKNILPYARARAKVICSASQQSRLLTTSTSNAIDRLKDGVEEYRLQNFSEELPSRCKKEIIRAADYHDDGKITIDGLYQIVSNIGAADDVSKADIGGIFDELGDHSSTENTIEVKDMLKLI